MFWLEGSIACHLTPVVAAPTLHQHQAVEVGAVLLVVGLEVVGRGFDVALQLGGEQHVAAQVIGVACAVVGCVAHGYGEVVLTLFLDLQA